MSELGKLNQTDLVHYTVYMGRRDKKCTHTLHEEYFWVCHRVVNECFDFFGIEDFDAEDWANFSENIDEMEHIFLLDSINEMKVNQIMDETYCPRMRHSLVIPIFQCIINVKDQIEYPMKH